MLAGHDTIIVGAGYAGSVLACRRRAAPQPLVKIQANFQGQPKDCGVSVAPLCWTRKVASHPAVSDRVMAETHPVTEVQDDVQILDATRRDETCQHAEGSCPMAGGVDAVLVGHLRVCDVQRLPVVDPSAMPTQVSGNTNAAVMARAWRAADLIEQDRRQALAANVNESLHKGEPA